MADGAGRLGLLLPRLVLAMAVCATSTSAESGAPTVGDVVRRAIDAAARVDDYTCTSTKQENVDGKMLAEETFVLKQRKEPDCVYLKWVQEPYKNRETIYCRARYGDKIRVHEGSGVAGWLGSLSLDPEGTFARRNNRHSIREAGIFHLLKVVRERFDQAKGDHAMGERPLAEADVHDQPSYCFSIDEEATKTEICLHRTLYLPTRVKTFDGSGRVIENYTWTDYHLNVGLKDRDFDVDNSAYGF